MERIELPDGKKVWLVTSHEEARRVLTDPRFSDDTARMGTAAPLSTFPDSIRAIVAHDMLNTDAPVHTRLRRLVARRREDPRDDLVSRLVTLRDNEDRLSDAELASMVFILVIAGQTATTQLLAKALHLLLTNRDQLDLVLRHPELPFRMATEPVEIAERTVPAGDIVVVSLRDANRDPDRYPDPDTFDVRRAEKQHLAFGHGVHRCIGANLAELQCQLGLATFLDAFPHSKVLDDGVSLRPTPLITVLEPLPVAIG